MNCFLIRSASLRVPLWLLLTFLGCIAADRFASARPANGWTLRHPIVQEDLTAVTAIGDCFYALGNAGSIAHSCNGTNWAVSPSGIDGPLAGLAYGNGRFIAVGTNLLSPARLAATLSHSTDGEHWQVQSYVDIDPFTSIAFGNGVFVAISQSGVTWTSPDGISWNESAVDTELQGIAFSDGTFLAVGGDPASLTNSPSTVTARAFASTNGLEWLEVIAQPGAVLRSVVAIPGGFLAFSSDHSYVLQPSTNAAAWTVNIGEPPPVSVGIGQGLIAAPFGLTTSSDGLQWTSHPASASLIQEDGQLPGNAIAFTNGRWVTVGARGAMAVSEDLQHWSFPDWVSNMGFAALAEGNGTLVAVGGTIITNANQKTGTGLAATSRDGGATWARQDLGQTPPLKSLAFGAEVFVAVGGNPLVDGTGIVLVSTDGKEWASQPISPTTPLNKVIYAQNQFVAVGGDMSLPSYALMTSKDGFIWTTRIAAPGNFYRDITFANGRYLLLLLSPWMYLYSSTDLATWDGPLNLNVGAWNLSDFTTTSLGLAYGNGVFRISGDYGMSLAFVSSNAVQWQLDRHTQPAFGAVLFAQGQFLGVGGTQAFTSSDGIRWKTKETGSREVLLGLAETPTGIFALGEHGTILQASPQGPRFQEPGVTFSNAGKPILQLESNYGAVLTVQRSLDLKNWMDLITLTNQSGLLRWAAPESVPAPDHVFYRAILPPQ